jgi:hypothetical protein
MYKLISLCCSFVFIIGLTACSQDKPKEQASTAQPAQQQQDIGMATAPAAPVTGKVLETMDAAGYTYINVATETGDKWIAVNQSAVVVGEEVTFMDGMVMQNFFSKSLDRTFPEIVFSSGLVGKYALPPGMGPAGTGAGSFSQALTSEGGAEPLAGGDVVSGSKKAVVPFAEIKVEKAPGENSFTVAEIFSKAAELNGQTVVVKGKVTKVYRKKIKRNWIHIQDGTGNPVENTHELVITTSQEIGADWDIITMEGVLAHNKSFSHSDGLSYVFGKGVIIEEASLKE